MYSAAVITVSDKGYIGERVDTSGPSLCNILKENGFEVIYTSIIPDEKELIKSELIKCADELNVNLVLTTGGTGFSKRDVTPEATLEVIEREARGIPELMRFESLKITKRACLSRSVAGIRKSTLIVNLPGSEKASRENLLAVLSELGQGIDMLLSNGSADCGAKSAKVLAVCISRKKGEQKVEIPEGIFIEDWGIEGDAHAGKWHRQVSLLGLESVRKVEKSAGISLSAGAFAENILVEGLNLYELPVGTKFSVGTTILELTQIGKECHSNCAIREAAGDCVMPREGIFTKVLKAGKVKKGDILRVIER